MLNVTVYGSETCEDTALARDHLRALDIPFASRYRETDPAVEDIIKHRNRGNVITPTIVFGNDEIVLAEPSLEQLEEALRAAGHEFQPIGAAQFRTLADLPAPDFGLFTTDGRPFELGSLRGRRKSVLFLAHGPDCRVCQGYTRQLAARREEWDEHETLLLLLVEGQMEQARAWAGEFAGGYSALADADGEVKRRYADYFSSDPLGVMLLVLDAYTAPRAGSFAEDAGGLITPGDAVEWMRLLGAECPE